MKIILWTIIVLFLQVLLVTGGLSVDYEHLASTEIYQDGQWREVGALPVALTRLKGASLDNTVFMTGESPGDLTKLDWGCSIMSSPRTCILSLIRFNLG